jgi:hypothetical protein
MGKELEILQMIIENRADGGDYIDASDQSSLADDIEALILKGKVEELNNAINTSLNKGHLVNLDYFRDRIKVLTAGEK